MNRLQQGLRVAPRAGIVLTFVAAGSILAIILFGPDDPSVPERILIGFLAVAFVTAYGLLLSYVYGDARRRGMRHVLWTLVAAFVPNALGFIAYFLLRDPVLQPCAKCGATTRRDHAFCPRCGAPLPRVCPSCRKPVELTWSHCAHCGSKLHEPSETPSPGESPT